MLKWTKNAFLGTGSLKSNPTLRSWYGTRYWSDIAWARADSGQCTHGDLAAQVIRVRHQGAVGWQVLILGASGWVRREDYTDVIIKKSFLSTKMMEIISKTFWVFCGKIRPLISTNLRAVIPH